MSDSIVDALTLGLPKDTLWLAVGLFILLVGVRCLPIDLRRPWGGGVIGVPVDVALIVFGLVMIADGAGLL